MQAHIVVWRLVSDGYRQANASFGDERSEIEDSRLRSNHVDKAKRANGEEFEAVHDALLMFSARKRKWVGCVWKRVTVVENEWMRRTRVSRTYSTRINE